MASHTPCEDVGRIAAAANCKTLAIVNHFVPEIGFRASADDFKTAIGSTFTGNLVIGRGFTVDTVLACRDLLFGVIERLFNHHRPARACYGHHAQFCSDISWRWSRP